MDLNQCLSQLKLWVRIPFMQGVLDTTLCDQVCQWLTIGRCFSPGTPVSSTNKTDHQDITEILLKVALNTITLIPTHVCLVSEISVITTPYFGLCQNIPRVTDQLYATYQCLEHKISLGINQRMRAVCLIHSQVFIWHFNQSECIIGSRCHVLSVLLAG